MPLLIMAIIAVFTAGRMARRTPAYLPTSGSLHQVRAVGESNRPPQRIGGLLVDSVPGIVGILYFARSARVKETLAGSRCP